MSRLADGIENLQFGMVNPTRKVIDPKETKERIEEAMKEAETKAPFDDESEPSDKAANEENPTRRTTISYDRTAVGAAAKKYAKNYEASGMIVGTHAS